VWGWGEVQVLTRCLFGDGDDIFLVSVIPMSALKVTFSTGVDVFDRSRLFFFLLWAFFDLLDLP
jgi:hypothetical protein